MDTNIIERCTELAFNDEMGFPETVKLLLATGVQLYYADLAKCQKVHYGFDGSVYTEQLPFANDEKPVQQFRQEEITAALAAIARNEIDYPEFLRRIIAAGVISYTAFLTGQKVVYVGREGQSYTEPFPQQLIQYLAG